MNKRIVAFAIMCALVMMGFSALADMNDYIDQELVNGADALSTMTVTGMNDVPFNDNKTHADILMLHDKDQTDAESEGIAFAKCENDTCLAVCYIPEDAEYYSFTHYTYNDGTRVMVSDMTAYVLWPEKGQSVKVTYDLQSGKFTVMEFGANAMDTANPVDVLAGAYFGYLSYTSDYTVKVKKGTLVMRENPSGSGSKLANIKNGEVISRVYDFTVEAENGYTYTPVYFEQDGHGYYGWVANSFLNTK